MATLSDAHKRYIVMRLACYDSPSEIAEGIKDEFGVSADRRQVMRYDPSRISGHDVSKKWRGLFWETRQEFRESAAQTPIANKNVRLRRLEDMAERARRKGNYPLAAQLLEQAAKEMGEAYTNRRELTGKNGGPVQMEAPGLAAIIGARRQDEEPEESGTE